MKDNKKTIGRCAVTAAAVALFMALLIQVQTGTSSRWEDPLRFFIYDLRNEDLTGIVILITHMADKLFIIALCIALLVIPYTRLTFGVPLSAGALGVTLLNQLLKHTIDRPRPDVIHLVEESGYSFPSGHSVTSFLFYGLAIWLVNRNIQNKTARIILTVLLAIPMFLVGPTRVYLGVHYPTDVLAGWCIALVGIIIVIEVTERRADR